MKAWLHDVTFSVQGIPAIRALEKYDDKENDKTGNSLKYNLFSCFVYLCQTLLSMYVLISTPRCLTGGLPFDGHRITK